MTFPRRVKAELPRCRSRVKSALPSPGKHARPFDEIVSGDERRHEPGDVLWIHRAVSVHSHDDLASGLGDPALQGVPLALSGLGQHRCLGADLLDDRHRVVGGASVDDDHLVNQVGIRDSSPRSPSASLSAGMTRLMLGPILGVESADRPTRGSPNGRRWKKVSSMKKRLLASGALPRSESPLWCVSGALLERAPLRGGL